MACMCKTPAAELGARLDEYLGVGQGLDVKVPFFALRAAIGDLHNDGLAIGVAAPSILPARVDAADLKAGPAARLCSVLTRTRMPHALVVSTCYQLQQ